MKPAPQTAFPLDSTHLNAAGKVEGAKMGVGAWRPIEDEPRDGARVLYYSPSSGIWIGNRPPECERGEWWPNKRCGWSGLVGAGGNETHFQPLPEPPTL